MNVIYLAARTTYEFLRFSEKNICTSVSYRLYCIRLDRMAIFWCRFLGHRPCHNVYPPLSTFTCYHTGQAESGCARHPGALFGYRNSSASVYYRFTSTRRNTFLPKASIRGAAFWNIFSTDNQRVATMGSRPTGPFRIRKYFCVAGKNIYWRNGRQSIYCDSGFHYWSKYFRLHHQFWHHAVFAIFPAT